MDSSIGVGNLYSLVAKRDLVTEIVKEWEIGREKQKELE